MDTQTETQAIGPTGKGYPNYPRISDRLKWARDRRGLSPRQLAETIEHPVHWLIIKGLEAGTQRETSPQLIDDLATRLKIDRGWLETGHVARSAAPTLPAPAVPSAPPVEAAPQRAPKVLEAAQAPPKLGRVPPGAMRAATPGTLGARLRERRLEMGLSQQKLSERLHSTNQTVSAMELNKPGLVAIQKQVEVLLYVGLSDDATKTAPTHEVFEEAERAVMRYRQIGPSKTPTHTRMTQPATPPPPPAPPPIAMPRSPAHFVRLGLEPGVARRVAAQRSLLGLTQLELSKRTGVPPHQISLIEVGKSTPPVNVESFARALDTTAEHLLRGTGTGASAFATAPFSIVSQAAAASPPSEAGRIVQRRATAAAAATKQDGDTEEATMLRPRQVSNIEVEADDAGFYLFCTGRSFKRLPGGETVPVSHNVATLALAPRLAKALRDTLNTAVQQYEQMLGPIT